MAFIIYKNEEIQWLQIKNTNKKKPPRKKLNTNPDHGNDDSTKSTASINIRLRNYCSSAYEEIIPMLILFFEDFLRQQSSAKTSTLQMSNAAKRLHGSTNIPYFKKRASKIESRKAEPLL